MAQNRIHIMRLKYCTLNSNSLKKGNNVTVECLKLIWLHRECVPILWSINDAMELQKDMRNIKNM